MVPALPVLPRLGTWYFGVVGQGRGEFETWRWLHWWMHRLLEFHAREAGGLGDLAVRILFLARDLDIGNMADTLFLSFPLEALVGAPASHNLKILLILVGNALAAGVLARTLGTQGQALWVAASGLARTPVAQGQALWVAAAGLARTPVAQGQALWVTAAGLARTPGAQGQALWVTAAGLALSPFVWTEVQECRMAEAILVFVFLGAAAWVRLQRNPTPKGGALFGSVLGLALVFYWFYGLWLAMWCLLTLVPSKRILSPLAVAAVVTAAISLPFLAPYLVGEGSRSPVPFGRSYPALEELDRLPAGQLGPLGPSLVLSQSLPPGWPLDPGQTHGFSLAWLALAVLGARRASWRWWVPTVAFWLLTLGPYPRWGGDFADLRLPYAWLYQWVPAWSRLFWPWRMVPFVVLSLVPLVLEGARRFRRPAVLFTLILLGELAWRGTLFLTAGPVVADPFYQVLGPREGVVELSYPWNSAMAGYQQAFHGRPTLGTLAQAWPHYGHPPDSLLADPRRYSEEPFLAWLDQVRQGPAGPPPPCDFLVRSGYRWVVVHTDWPGSQDLAGRLEAALGAWDFRDASVTAWRLDSP